MVTSRDLRFGPTREIERPPSLGIFTSLIEFDLFWPINETSMFNNSITKSRKDDFQMNSYGNICKISKDLEAQSLLKSLKFVHIVIHLHTR